MGMLRLAPEIQNQILNMPNVACRPPISERLLRSIEAKPHHREQIREYLKFLA
jgi:hypothetical protein